MKLPVDPIDCRPLVEPPADVRFSDADLRRLEPVRRVLLSPLDHDGIDAWRSAVNGALIEAFGADAAMFQLEVPGHQACYSDEFDMELLAEYGREIMPDLNRTVALYDTMLAVGAGNRSMAWRDQLPWLYASDYFNEKVRVHRSFDPLWCVTPVEGARFPAILHAYHASLDPDTFFGPRDIRLMAFLQPSLEAGVQTVVRAATNRRTLTRSLDAQSHGAMVFDPDGRLVHRNPAMARIARTQRGEDRLAAAGREMAAGLLSPTAGLLAAESGTRAVEVLGARIRLHGVRVGEGMFGLRPVALITASAERRRLPDRAAVADRFGLTPRQSEVTLLLAERKTNPEMAELLHISEHTVGSHVEAVMRQLGVRDRREIRGILQGDTGK